MVRDRTHQNRIQTNLFVLTDEKLEFLKRNDFGIGVSFDIVPGARLDTRGAPTEERVLANVLRLEARGIKPRFLVVIAAHTAGSIDSVYEFLRDRGQPCRLLPLFDGPTERSLEGVAADRKTINSALMHMFRRWFEDGCPFPVRIFDEYLMVVTLKMLGLPRGFRYDRRVIGDKIFLVNLDGRIYQPCTDYSDEFALGNLSTQTIDEIFASRSYELGLNRDDTVRCVVCEPCEYYQACGCKEMFMANDGGANQDRCITAQPLSRAIEQYLEEQGVNAGTLLDYIPDALLEFGYS
jgi:radical SAM protein with 4Fe4S-binding SPASM domain